MPNCRILAIDAAGLTVWRPGANTVAREAEFAATAEDVVAFASYLRRHASTEFRLLADLGDEDFAFEDIPAVRGRDRRQLIGRTLNQLGFGASLHIAVSEGRREDGRRDERILFAALTHSEAIDPWLRELQSAAAAVRGLHITAQLAERLCSMSERHHHRLVVTLGRAGLRQTYLEQGGLRFSRLTPLDDVTEAALTCVVETAKLRQYLSGRHVPRTAKLAVQIVAPAAGLDGYRAAFDDAATDVPVEYVALEDQARRAGLVTYPHLTCDALLAYLLTQRRPRGEFAPTALRRPFLLHRIDMGIRRGAWLALAAGLLTGGMQTVDAWRWRQKAEALRASTEADSRRYETRLAELPPAPADAGRLSAIVGRYDDLVRHSATPAAAYRRLSATLSAFPDVTLERLDWRVANDAKGMHTVLDIHAVLAHRLAGDPRAQIGIADSLAAALQSGPGAQAELIAPPFSADSAKPLASRTVGDAATPKFSLRLRQPLP